MSDDKKYVVDLRIIAEWDWEKNNELGLDPQKISHGSTKHVFWICSKGHRYKARVDHRTIMGSSCPYCKGKIPIVGENDLATLYPHLLKEWDYEYNAPKIPSDFLSSSNKRVGWICSSCGNKWVTAIVHRTGSSSGCPKCAEIQRATTRTKTAAKKSGSLAEKYEKLLDEWDFDKNTKIIPTEVSAMSNKKVWWKCRKEGHSYVAPIGKRTIGQGCPICANKKILKGYNDLATEYSYLCKEWHPTRNGNLCPEDVFSGSNKRVWWKCNICNYEWRAYVYSRTGMNTGCPVCAGKIVIYGLNDITTTHPELVVEWDYEKNIECVPEEVSAGSNKRIWWICNKGHKWNAQINDRTHGRGCPICANTQRPIARQKTIVNKVGSLLNTNPKIAKQWHEEMNFPLFPNMISAGSSKKVWWKCEKGHVWQANINSRVKGNGCPICNGEKSSSFPEQAILFYLSQVTETIHRHKVDGYEIDVYLPAYNTGIEYNGRYYHRNRKEFDDKKMKYLQFKGINMIYIIECDKDGVDDAYIFYKYRKASYDNFGIVIEQILKRLSLYINHIDINRDRMLILEQYIIIEKENSFGNRCPDLVPEWNNEKNGKLSPYQVSHGSNKKVWWKCSKCAYEWQAVVHSRKKSGCPCCSGRICAGFNDLFTKMPNIANYWDYEKNEIQPSNLGPKSKLKVWWKCENNHSWNCSVQTQVKRIKCPYC